MAAERKKEVQYEADSSQARVDDYFRKNPMTGDPFKDIGGLLATRDDRNRAIAARKSLDAAADRDVTMRGQDVTKELGLGEIGVRKDANNVARMGHQLGFDAEMGRTAAYERGQNQQFELGKGELDINRAVLGMQQDRYDNVTKVSDRLSLAEKAAGARVGAAESGFELSDDLFKETSKYLKDGKPAEGSKVAAPTSTPAAALDPLTSSTKVQQFSGYEPYPDVLEAAPITHYGKGILPQIGGSAVEGIKLLGRTAARITAADPLSPSRRYKRKVNK